MKILLLSRYEYMGASSRVRSLQYLPFLESVGWHVTVSHLFSDLYLKAIYSGQSNWRQVFSGYWRRLQTLVEVGNYDLIWIEKELFPFLPALLERLLSKLGVPYVVDYDDALFHRYDQHPNWLVRSILSRKIDSVMRLATLVIAGNKYLAERAQAAGAHLVEIVPTVVDLKRYIVAPSGNNSPLVVGWIGSPSTCHYLTIVLPVFERLKKDFNVRFVAVGADKNKDRELPIEVCPWTQETEVQSIQSFDIGIMPLLDSPWERGKCGYKLIQYMACGLPVVASSVGVNTQIVKHGINGFLVQGQKDWEWALRNLLTEDVKRLRMGKNGRELVEKCYSLQVQAPRLESLLHNAVR